MVVVFAASACWQDLGATADRPANTQLTPITPSRTATTTSATSTTPVRRMPNAGADRRGDQVGGSGRTGGCRPVPRRAATRQHRPTRRRRRVHHTVGHHLHDRCQARHTGTGLPGGPDRPATQPPDVYGVWKGGWVDFDGAGVQVGSAHGDPGRFSSGQGPELPYDRSLSFGDYRCRTDETALFCVNYAHQSAVRFSAGGIDTYACARQLTRRPVSACSTSASARRRGPDRHAPRRCPASGSHAPERVSASWASACAWRRVSSGSTSSSTSASISAPANASGLDSPRPHRDDRPAWRRRCRPVPGRHRRAIAPNTSRAALTITTTIRPASAAR